MNAVLTVAEIVAPVMILASIGYGWVWLGHDYQIRFVTKLATSVALPCLIFSALMKSTIDPSALATISLAALASYGVIALFLWGFVAFARLDIRTYLAPLIFGNTGNLGLPLALFAFGDLGLGYALAVFAISIILTFTLGIWLVSDGGSIASVIREPIVIGPFLGALFLWQGWETPRFLTNAIDLVGQLAIPLMLITLGVALARLKRERLSRMAGLSVVKATVCIGVAWVAGRWFGLDEIAFAVLVVQIGTPVAVTSYLLAEKYEANADEVAGLVFASTLLSIIILPALLSILI